MKSSKLLPHLARKATPLPQPVQSADGKQRPQDRRCCTTSGSPAPTPEVSSAYPASVPPPAPTLQAVAAPSTRATASAWANLRPGPAPFRADWAQKRSQLEALLLVRPSDQEKLCFLVDLGLHALAYGKRMEADIFCELVLLPSLQEHVHPSRWEQAQMLAFAGAYDRRYDFTGYRARPYSYDVYEAQAAAVRDGSAGQFLGYLYLRDARQQPPWEDLEPREELVVRLLASYGSLRKTTFFAPPAPGTDL